MLSFSITNANTMFSKDQIESPVDRTSGISRIRVNPIIALRCNRRNEMPA
jgi:hypothetical protein